jgi:hypothetical protein
VEPGRSERSVIRNQGSFAGTHFPDEPKKINIKDFDYLTLPLLM